MFIIKVKNSFGNLLNNTSNVIYRVAKSDNSVINNTARNV